MAKKKQKFPRPRKSILVAAAVVLALGAGYLTYYFAHNHAITVDKTRFAQAGNDVETVATQIVATVGQPADRKDGGKCTYAHQKYTKGPLSCEVYSYLAYGVNSPDDANVIVQKVDPLHVLHGTPWQFKELVEKPHEFTDGVNYSDSFVVLHNLFDTEVRTTTYTNKNGDFSCAVGYLYFNSVARLSGYPDMTTNSAQNLLIDIDCTAPAKQPYFQIQ